MTISVDAEFENLCPPLTKEEFSQLEKNILEEGECHDPICLWNGLIVDGHNRWRIIQSHPDIGYETREMVFLSRNDAMAWIIRNQLGRRNLPNYERARLALRLKETIAAEAKAKQESTLKQNSSVNQKSDERNELNTNKELAKVAGVSHDTIHKVDVIEQKAPEEVKDQLRRGEVSINKAYNEIRDAEKVQPCVEKAPPEPPPAPEYSVDDLLLEIGKNADAFVGFLRSALAVRNGLYQDADNRKKVFDAVHSVSKRITEIESLLK